VSAFADDSTIDDNEIIWRRIPENWVVPDNNLERRRPTSQFFLQDGPVSVYIASEAQSAQVVMEGGKEKFLVALTVAFIRQLGLSIIRDPSLGGSGHALVHGRITKRMSQKMAKAATWVEPYAP